MEFKKDGWPDVSKIKGNERLKDMDFICAGLTQVSEEIRRQHINEMVIHGFQKDLLREWCGLPERTNYKCFRHDSVLKKPYCPDCRNNRFVLEENPPKGLLSWR